MERETYIAQADVLELIEEDKIFLQGLREMGSQDYLEGVNKIIIVRTNAKAHKNGRGEKKLQINLF